ncbi:hypothetical protein ES703_99362 [subsurface metagenome]
MNVKQITGLVVVVGICFSMGLQGCDADANSKAPAEELRKGAGHKNNYPVQPVSFTDVKVTDDFWAPRIETNRKVSIPYAFGKCAETGRIDNFAIAGGLMKGEHRANYPFDDTDPYKILEGPLKNKSQLPLPVQLSASRS